LAVSEKAQFEARILQKIGKLKNFYNSIVKDSLVKEAYNKRLHLLFHVIRESEISPWESKNETKDIFNHFLINVLKIDPAQLHPVDLHRLPQRPVYKDGIKSTRPIIVKFSSVYEKLIIYNHLKHLKTYNLLNNQSNQIISEENSDANSENPISWPNGKSSVAYVTKHFICKRRVFCISFVMQGLKVKKQFGKSIMVTIAYMLMESKLNHQCQITKFESKIANSLQNFDPFMFMNFQV